MKIFPVAGFTCERGGRAVRDRTDGGIGDRPAAGTGWIFGMRGLLSREGTSKPPKVLRRINRIACKI